MNTELLNSTGPGLQHAGGYSPMTREELGAQMQREGFAERVNFGRTDPVHRRRVREAARAMADCMQGRLDPFLYKQLLYPTHAVYREHLASMYPGLFPATGHYNGVRLVETMSYSDYSALTVDVLDRMLYGYYTAAPITNEPLVKKHPLRDFRVVARYEMDGATTPWSAVTPPPGVSQAFPTVPHAPGEPPTERAMAQAAREVLGSTQRVTYQPQLYQGKMSVNWRALVNDDLGIFRDQVQRLAIGGRRTIYSFITSLYTSTTGLNTTLCNATFGNLMTAAAVPSGVANHNLDFQGLIDALTILEQQKDLDGQPITFDGQLYLVYGPSLETTAAALLNKVQQADISVGGGTTNAQGFPSQRLRVDTQFVTRNMKPIQDKYLPILITSAGVKNTFWGLVYDPNAQARPAIELGQLTGFETPQLYQKVPNTMRVGGGVDPMMGDWNTMDQEYKGCLVMGGTQIDGRSVVFSTGQNA